MSTLFNRNVYVVFGPKKKIYLANRGEVTSIVSITSWQNLVEGDKIRASNLGVPYVKSNISNDNRYNNIGISQLRVSFQVKSSLEEKTNEADILIYNVSENSYKMLQKENETYSVQLSVGYGDVAKESIFIGDIENSFYYREGSDWVLKIKGKDGQELIQDSIISKTYTEEKDLKSIMLDMIKSSKNKPKEAYKRAKKWLEGNIESDKKTQNGITVNGGLMTELNKILDEFNATLSIQDEKAQIIWKNGHSNNDIVLLSPSTGLIGSPVQKGEGEGIEFKSLLIPIIKPGGLVRIQSKSTNDYFRVDNISYSGDTHGKNWECKAEAVKPDNIITTLPQVRYYNNLSIEQEIGQDWKRFL